MCTDILVHYVTGINLQSRRETRKVSANAK